MHPGRDSNDESHEQSQKHQITFHPNASIELIEASNFYESRQSGLGLQSLDSITKGLDSIRSDPLIWNPDRLGRRKYIIWKFPYLLIFQLYR